jgi:hypothetical protein
MSEATVAPSPVSTDIEAILKTWAQAQAPTRDFEGDRVFIFVQPVRHSEGAFFVPGELALGHLAEGEAAAEALGRGFPQPLAIWSYSLGREIIVPPGLVRLDRRPSVPAREAPPAAPK